MSQQRNIIADSWGRANWRPSCDRHDRCYGYNSRTNRLTCDTRFRTDLLTACAIAYPIHSVRGTACAVAAVEAYTAVRLGGWANYKGKGKNN